MKTTISLGSEIGYYANRITNVFTTKDYLGSLQSEYRAHVNSFYDKNFTNDFRKVYLFKHILTRKDFKPVPYDNPLDDIEEAREELTDILENKAAYKPIIKIFLDDCKGTNDAGFLIYDLLDVLKSSSKDFMETALKYDRYMGSELSVVQVVHAIHAYGQLTGLVDFYNFKEGKDG